MRRSACDTHVFVGLVLLLACTTWGTAQNTNYEKIALLKVYPGIQTSSAFSVGAGPRGMAFDGDNIWVTNSGSNSVTKLHASNGAVQGTFSVGDSPRGVAFDGVNIWWQTMAVAPWPSTAPIIWVANSGAMGPISGINR